MRYASALLVALLLAVPLAAQERDGIAVFVRSTAPDYREAREDLLRLRPDGVHMPGFDADPQVAAEQAAELRASGVRWITGYKDFFTRRPSYLRQVYDNWADFGMTIERPEAGPETWAQRGVDGEILLAYSDTRYMMCPNNPNWRAISREITRDLAEGEVNGVMCDNPMCACYCEHCASAFDHWMREEGREEVARELPGVDPDAGPIPMYLPGADAERQRMLLGLCRRFWVDAMADFFRDVVKAAGEAVDGEGNFFVAPNSGGHRWFWAQTARGVEPAIWGDAVSTMYVEPGVFPGLARTRYFCGLQGDEAHTNWFDYLYAEARGPNVSRTLQKAYTGVLRNPGIAHLALLEGFAHSGAFVIYPPTNRYPGAPDMNVEWAQPVVEFIREHRDLMKSQPAAPVAVVYSPYDAMFGFDEHYPQALLATELLRRQHIPHRLIHASRMAEALAEEPPELVILPHARVLPEAAVVRLGELTGTAETSILALGECATHDISGAPSRLKLPGARLDVTLSDTLPVPAAKLHSAVCGLLGRRPSVVAPEEYPHVSVELRRLGNRWQVHLLNYAIPFDTEQGATDAVPIIRDLEVTVPVTSARAEPTVTLIRPLLEDVALSADVRADGMHVTVPGMGVYALLEVEGRPLQGAPEVADPAAEGLRAASSMAIRQVGPSISLAPVDAGSANAPETVPALRDTQEWYLKLVDDAPLRVEASVAGRAGGHPLELTLITLEGEPVSEVSSATGPDVMEDWSTVETLTLETAGPGDYLLVAESGGNLYRMRPLVERAVLLAGGGRALHICDPEPTAPMYFHVPPDRERFTITASAPQEDESLRLIVRDPSGAVVLDEAGEMDATGIFEIEVAPDQRGRAWSFTLGPGPVGRQDDIFVTLKGIDPFTAHSPQQLLSVTRD